MCQAIAGRGFEYIYAVDIQILFSCVCSDFGEAVA